MRNKLITSLAITTLLLTACETEVVVPEVVVNEVKVQELPQDMDFTGIVKGGEESVLSFNAGGIIENINVDIGDTVMAGETLASLGGTGADVELQASQNAFANALLIEESMLKLLDSQVLNAQSAIVIAEKNLDVANTTAESDTTVSAQNLSLAQENLSNLEKFYDQQYKNMIESIRSTVTQASIVVHNSVSYMMAINDYSFSENNFELDSKFVSGDSNLNNKTEKAIISLRKSSIELEAIHKQLNQGGVDEDQLLVYAARTLEILREMIDTVQLMYDVVTRSTASYDLPNSDISEYKNMLSSYGAQGQNFILGQSDGQQVGLVGIAQSIASLNAERDLKVDAAKRQVILAEEQGNTSVSNTGSHADIASAQLDQSKIALQMAQAEKGAQTQKLRTDVDAAEARMKAASIAYNNSLVRAPFVGVIADKYIDSGSVVAPGTPILKIVDQSKMEIEVFVSLSDKSLVKVGDQAEILVDDQVVTEATVERIAPAAQDNSKKVKVKLVIDEVVDGLITGQAVDVRLHLNEVLSGIFVTETAVVNIYGEDFVYVADGDVAKMVKVTVGSIIDGQIEILDGLSEGDLIITKGLSKISDGGMIKLNDE